MTEHKWKMCGYTTIPDEVDKFAAENMPSEYHNGPKCEVCGFEFCTHCSPEGWKTKCGTKSIPANPAKTSIGEELFKSIKFSL